MNKHRSYYALGMALAGTCLLMYWRYLAGYLPIGADNSLFYAPFYSMGWDGGPPLWNSYSLSGTPLVNNLQAALLYPLRWPFYFLHDWRSYFGLFMFLHYLVACCGMAFLLRALGLRRGAVLGGAILFAAGGHMAGRIINPTIFQACCWLPWLMAGAVGRARVYAWVTTLGWAMILWIGSPHLMFYGLIGYLVTFFFCGILPLLRRGDRHALTALLFSRAGHLLLALMLAAPTLIPGIQRAQQSIRTRATIEANLVDSIQSAELPAIFLGGTGATIYPEFIDQCCYVGAVALLLGIFLIFRRASWRDSRFHLALALILIGVFFAMGKNVGVHYLIGWLPGLKNMAGASRALILCAVGFSLLSALSLDALPARPIRIRAVIMLGLGAVLFFIFTRRAAQIPAEGASSHFFRTWLGAWVVAPECLMPDLFYFIDSAAVLIAGGLILLLCGARHRLRLILLAGLILGQLWHFAPRVLPPLKQRDYFNPPPSIAALQTLQARSPLAPFRVASHDPLRMHDVEISNYALPFLMPNLATLYHLEDIQGFDPLILLNYAELFEKTSGRLPFNDPIRNLDIDRPDLRLFDFLGVRYLIGHPYDRRLTTRPQTLDSAIHSAPVTEWEEQRIRQPITQWFMVSLLDHALNTPVGTEVARLHVEAREGTFVFPIRNGLETADLHALNFLQLLRAKAFRPTVNMIWITHQPAPSFHYQIKEANYRGVINFGRPLTVTRLSWEILNSETIFNIAAQGYRLARPAAAQDPWQLVAGHEDSMTPVFEYRQAKPRAFLVRHPAGAPLPAGMDALASGPSAGAVQWLARRNSSMDLQASATSPALLVLREIWTPGWQATVNGAAVPILPVQGLLRGIELPPGSSAVHLAYRPRFPQALLLAAILSVIFYLLWLARRRRENYEL